MSADEDAILVVDDDVEVAAAVAENLADDGHRVLVAHSGREARECLDRARVAVLLLDLRLPDVSGLALLREFRAAETPPDVIIMTGYASLETAVEAMEAGAGGYVEKPLEFARVRRVVARALERQRLLRENRALVMQLDARRAQAEALYGISVTLASTLDLTEALRRLCGGFATLFGADTVSVFMSDGVGERLTPVAAYHVPKDMRPALTSLTLPLRSHGFYGPLWRDRQPVASDDVGADARFGDDAFRTFPHQSAVLLPLVVDDQVVGAFYLVWWRTRYAFTDDARRLAQQVCGQVSLLLHNARLFEHAERAGRQLAALNEVSRHLAAVHETDRILALIVDEARALLGADAAGIRMLEDDVLVPRARTAGASGIMSAPRQRVGEGLSGRIVATGTPLVIEDVDHATDVGAADVAGLHGAGMAAFIGVPLRAAGRVLGCLNFYWRAPRRCSADDLALVAAFSDQAALALEKGRLLGETEGGRRLLERLYASAITLETSWSVADRLDAFVRGVREVLDFDRVTVFLLAPDRTRLDLATSVGAAGDAPRTLPLTPETGPIYDVVTTRKPVAVRSDEDLGRVRPLHPRWQSHPHLRVRRFVIAPLVSGERVAGVAIADNKPSGRPIAATAVEPFTLLCQQLATAVESARLYAAAGAREREAAALYEVTSGLGGSAGVDEVLELIARRAVDVVGGDGTGIFTWEAGREALTCRHAFRLAPALTGPLALRPGEGVCGRAFVEQGPVWTRDRREDPTLVYGEATAALVAAHAPCAQLAVPIVAHGEVFGVLAVYHETPHDFGAAEIRLLSSLAHHAAVALERARLYEETERHRRLLAEIFESTSDGIVLVRRDGAVVSANRRAAELLGFDPAARAADGLPAALACHFPDTAALDAALGPLRAALLGAGHGEGDVELPAAARTLHWVARPAGGDGADATVTLTFHDVTQEREVSRMKSDFVSFVTHQLRTPLAGIKWLLELVSESLPAGEEVASYVGDAREAAERLIRLVNELLDVSRLESGKVKISPAAVDLAELTDDVLHEVGTLVKEHGHRLTVTAAPAPRVVVDRQLMRQVLLNFLSNAIKYTPAGGDIQVRIEAREDGVAWAVRDSGIGVPADAQAHLFEKFFRADNGRILETEGTGLGLYLTKLIVERFEGHVWCESNPGAGATFGFVVPA